MLDDVGFGASSTFGGPCRTPVFERLAGGGLKVTRFHTTGRLNGDIHWVQVDIGANDADHFIEPDEQLRIAMARQ
jgi:hypothetical protein